MNKETIVQFLIDDEHSEWHEEDRGWLMSLDDEKLNKMRTSVENLDALKRTGSINAAGSPEEFVAQAPERIKEVLDRGLRMVNEQKDRIVQTLVQNLTEEQLRKKSIEELEDLAAAIGQRSSNMEKPDFSQLPEMLKSAGAKAGESTIKSAHALKEKLSGTAQGLAKEAEILPTLHDEVRAALTRMQEWDKSLKSELEKAYGFAVFPSIGRASLVLGVTYGKGEVFEQNRVVGYAGTVQITVGVQIGGETLHEIVIFDDKEGLDRFKAGKVSFAANASVAMVKGAAATSKNPNGMRVFVYNQGGEMLEADIGGQTFRFIPAGPLTNLSR